MFLTIFLFAALLACLALLYVQHIYSYWKRKGLDYLEPNFFEGVGNQWIKTYKQVKAKGLKHGGYYVYFKPIYLPVDLEILRHIILIDFSNFVNRDGYPNEESDPLRAHLVNLRDEKWKNLRAKLSPTFTSGNLLFRMYSLYSIL